MVLEPVLIQVPFSTLLVVAKTPGFPPPPRESCPQAALCSIPKGCFAQGLHPSSCILWSQCSSTKLQVKPILISGGNGPILSQGSYSWETCPTNTSRSNISECERPLRCFRLQLRKRLCEQGSHHATGTMAQASPTASGL